MTIRNNRRNKSNNYNNNNNNREDATRKMTTVVGEVKKVISAIMTIKAIDDAADSGIWMLLSKFMIVVSKLVQECVNMASTFKTIVWYHPCEVLVLRMGIAKNCPEAQCKIHSYLDDSETLVTVEFAVSLMSNGQFSYPVIKRAFNSCYGSDICHEYYETIAYALSESLDCIENKLSIEVRECEATKEAYDKVTSIMANEGVALSIEQAGEIAFGIQKMKSVIDIG
jgi:hypothetical protein